MKFRSKNRGLVANVPASPGADLVRSLYQRLLLRSPDVDEIAGWIAVLEAHGIDAVVKGVAESEEFLEGNRLQRRVTERWSRSQYGETEILLNLITRTLDPQPMIVEVGAAGVEISNSVDLIATLGWNGLLVEASPTHAEQLRVDLEEISANVVSCAIGPEDGEATFYVGVHPHLSSLDREMAASWGPIQGEMIVPVRRLASVLREWNVPASFMVLSIDIEGLDFKVLNDLIENSSYRPRWVIIEWGSTLPWASMDEPQVSGAVRDEYSIVAKTFSNVILQHRDAHRTMAGSSSIC